MRALVRMTERGQNVVRCSKCWLGFKLSIGKTNMLRRAVRHYRGAHHFVKPLTKAEETALSDYYTRYR